jgi:hypothetical protein
MVLGGSTGVGLANPGESTNVGILFPRQALACPRSDIELD